MADVLSRLELKEEEFSLDALAFDDLDFPVECPLSYKEIAHAQSKDRTLKEMKTMGTAQLEQRKHSSHVYELLVNKDGKILVPKSLQQRATE